MNPNVLSRLADGALRRGMVAAVPRFHTATATLIAYLAEFDARRLYAPEGYPSMCAFCVRELGLTDQVARKLIRVGRTARRFPVIFEALADGRLNPTGVILLTPWLTSGNVTELLAAAARKTNDEIRELLADRAPRLDAPLSLEARSGGPAGPLGHAVETSMVSAQTPETTTGDSAEGSTPASFGHTAETSMVSAQTPVTQSRPRLEPLGGGRFETRFTMGRRTRDVLRRFEEVMGVQLTSEQMDEAVRRGLEAMIAAYEERRFGATDRPQRQARPARGRHIPAAVRRAVRNRDGGRCTFVAESGRRCEARGKLEFDHVIPVARGGASTSDNLRLRCRAHNQYEAERSFGAGFMHETRERAREGRERAASGKAADLEVIPWLLRLGFRKGEANEAAARCADMMDAPLEARMRAALCFLSPPARVERAHGATAGNGVCARG